MKINHLDLFSGIGGFAVGLRNAGFNIKRHCYSEIDKHAIAIYKKQFKEAEYVGAVESVRCGEIRKTESEKWIVTFGSPCQDLSIAGKRKGMEGGRSSLFYEATRIIRELKPDYFIWENVKGAYSSNGGLDFVAVLREIAQIGGYGCTWELCNTRWFLPQNRERIYLVGCLGGLRGREIFPVGESIGENDTNTDDGTRIIDLSNFGGHRESKICPCLATRDYKEPKIVKQLNQVGTIGKDSEATRVYDTSCARTIKDGGGMGAKTGLYQTKSRIRRLTPLECERLQGFPDNWTAKGIYDGKEKEVSDTQRYKCCGNAVTTNVVQAIGEKLK